jgi:hypothetical protein
MAGPVSNSGKWKAFANGAVLYGPSGSGQNLNDDLEQNIGNDLDAIVSETVGDTTVSGMLVAAGAGLSVTITAGTTYCAGQRVKSTSAGAVSSLPDNTAGIKIYVEPTTPWNSTNKAWPPNYAQTTGALVAGQVLLATVTTAGGAVTVVTDGRVILVNVSGKVAKAGDTMTGALLFSPDNTVDIGAAGATRPRTIYVGTSVGIGGTPPGGVQLFVKNAAGGSVRIVRAADATGLQLEFDDSVGAISTTTNLPLLLRVNLTEVARVNSSGFVAGADNTYDLGTAAIRWGNGFFSASVRIGTNPASAGAIRLPNNNTIAWRNPGNTADNFIRLNAADAFEFSAQVTLALSGRAMLFAGATTGISYEEFLNTGGDMFVGLNGTAAGGLFVGSTAYASSIGSANATPLELATNNTVRFRIDSAGASSFLSGTVTFTSATAHVGGIQVGASGASAGIISYDGSENFVVRAAAAKSLLLGAGGATYITLTSAGLLSQIAAQAYTSTYTPQAQFGTIAAATIGDIQIVGSKTSNGDTAVIEFINHAVGLAAEPRLAAIAAVRSGANNTGDLIVYTTAAGSISEKIRISSAGIFLVGTSVVTGSSAGDIVVAQGSSYRSLMAGGTSQVMLRSTSIGGADVTQLTNGSGSIPVIGSPLTVGGAAGGDLVLATAAGLRWANNAGATTVRGFDKDSSDNFHIAGNGGSVKLASDTVIAGTNFLSVGATPATTGAVRLANNTYMIGRNAANGADVQAIGIDTSDRILIGPVSAANIRMGGQVRCDIDTSSRLVLPVGAGKYAV